jgi:hypothetical protein
MEMNMVKLSELNLLSFGHTIQMAGAIFQGEGQTFLAFFPEDADNQDHVLNRLELSLDDWNAIIRQTDLLETEILARAADGTLTKVVIRKSQRQIEQGVSWKVFKRDGYSCRYCGKDDIPLTVDHLVCWEAGGPSIVENLVSACRKCNKTRGDLSYADWLNHPYYRKVASGLSASEREANIQLLQTLGSIPLNVHKRSR